MPTLAYSTKSPFFLLLLSAFLSACIIPFSLLFIMDLHYADTYLVVNSYILPVVAFAGLLAVWLFCKGLQKYLNNKTLVYVHVILTSVFLVFVALSPLIYNLSWGSGMAGTPGRYYANWTIDRYRNPLYFGEIIAVALLLAVVSQILLFINFIQGYFKSS